MYTIRNNQNYNAFKKYKGEVNNGEDRTEPNQTLSLKDIITRHTRGQFVPHFRGEFEDENDPLAKYDLQRMDKVERMELLEATKNEINSITNKLQANEKLRTELERKQFYESQFREQDEERPRKTQESDSRKRTVEQRTNSNNDRRDDNKPPI